MPIFIVKCPGCETKYKVDTDKVKSGSKIRCPKCKTVFVFKIPGKFLEQKDITVKEDIYKKKEEEIKLEVPPNIPPEERKIHERALRLAKILARDIINYYRERWERALRDGNLKEEFKREIMESWKYYCEKVPKEIRDKTNYFQDAFNLIVGKGKKFL
ncbi:MAG: zinc-ribbon domain-containing protein [Candidatus Hydrothermales bacterium]